MALVDQIAQLTDATLMRIGGFQSLHRARRYVSEGRVQSIDVSDQVVLARVNGSRPGGYSVVLSAAGTDVNMSCSCPLMGECKHCFAVVLTLRAQAQLQRAAQQWQSALRPFTPTIGDQGKGLAIQFEMPTAHDVTLQLLSPGRNRPWVKSDIDWDRIHMHSGYNERQRRAAIALSDGADITTRRPGYGGYYGYYRDATKTLPLDRLASSCWRWLREARAAGVVFLPPRNLEAVVIADEPARVVIEAATRRDESVRLRTFGEVEGERIILDRRSLLGEPPHGLVRTVHHQLVLTPFDEPLDDAVIELATRQRELQVPASEVGLFAASYLPALRRRLTVRDDQLVVPETKPPQVVVDLFVHDAGGELKWFYSYDLGGRRVEVPAAPGNDDAPFRDTEAERVLTADLGDGPWWHAGATPPPQLIDVFLAGRDWMRFVAHTLPRWQDSDDIIVRVTGEPREYREAESAPEVRLTVQPPDAAHWFGLDVDVSIDGEQVPFTDLFTALALGQRELVLDSGLWFDLERPELQQLRDLIGEAAQLTDSEPGELQLRPEHAGLWEELVELGVIAEQSSAWRDAVDALLHVERLPQVDPPSSVQAVLRPYQLTGFRWLTFLWRSGLGGILADEMGLGKTLQALSFVAWAKHAGELAGPVLVIAPTSVIGTWAREAAQFTPGLRVVMRTETTGKSGVPVAEQATEADIIITSYTLARIDEDEFAAQAWSAVLLDEAQFVKNRQSQSYKAVRRLRARMKVALTGTPLENNLMDLWSMLSITAPGLFSEPKTFTELYRRPIEGGDAEVLGRLQKRIRPLILRRTKQAVATELPPKQEQVLEVELSASHRRIYDRQLQRERQKVLRLIADLDQNRITVLRSLTLLRQMALTPSLVDAKYDVDSAKLDTLVERVKELASEGHRALVFSQFTSYLGLARERLKREGIGASYLDGRTRDRAKRIDEFRTGDNPVFLISLKAGGFGLTLIEADYVFILDPWWNPAAENQAIDRTHRIGQTSHVMVYRLVSANTIEQKVLDLQRAKKDLFDKVVGGADADLAAPLSADDIRGLLSD